MNEKLKKMLENINNLKDQVKNLVGEGKLEDAQKKKKELIEAQKAFDLLYDLEDDADGGQPGEGAANGRQDPGAGDGEPGCQAPTVKEVGNALVDMIRARLHGKKAPEDAVKILKRDAAAHDMLREADGAGHSGADTGEDGGLTVPQDITTSIRELRRATDDDLERYVNIENVATLTGSRVIETDADTTAWPEVAEGAAFQEQDTPKLHDVKYKIKKYGGILKVTAELLEDTAENILAWLRKWIAKKSRATRNAKILAALEKAVGETTYEIKTIDELKDIFNVVLDPAVAQASRVITNQTGYNYLDKLKDADGKYILQPDPTKPTQMMLFGKYPVVKLSNKVLKDVAGSSGDVGKNITTVYCGCTEDAITLFDRNVISLDISTQAGDLWEQDKTGMKVRGRFDVQVVDTEAVIKGVIKIPTAG